MGNAKRRGTYDERRRAAIERRVATAPEDARDALRHALTNPPIRLYPSSVGPIFQGLLREWKRGSKRGSTVQRLANARSTGSTGSVEAGTGLASPGEGTTREDASGVRPRPGGDDLQDVSSPDSEGR